MTQPFIFLATTFVVFLIGVIFGWAFFSPVPTTSKDLLRMAAEAEVRERQRREVSDLRSRHAAERGNKSPDNNARHEAFRKVVMVKYPDSNANSSSSRRRMLLDPPYNGFAAWHEHFFPQGGEEDLAHRYDAVEDETGRIFVWSVGRQEAVCLCSDQKTASHVAMLLASEERCSTTCQIPSPVVT